MSNNSLQETLALATKHNIITPEQMHAILALSPHALSSNNSYKNASLAQRPKFNLSHLLYYFGGLLAIGAMSLFMTLGFDQFGSVAIIAICLCYAVAGGGLARFFWQKNLLTPYSLTLGFILCLVPLLVFAIQDVMGIWQSGTHYQDYHAWIDWQWLMMEFAMLAVGAVMLWRFKRAFLMLPIAVTLWYMSMDIVPLINDMELDFELRSLVSLYFGLLIIGLALWIDIRQDRKLDGQDFAFWLYIVGVLTFWGGLTLQDSDSELAKFLYFLINLAMMFVGVLLRRRVFMVFGVIGSLYYMGHLARDLFENSMIFPLIMTFVGLGVVFLGIYWQRHQEQIYRKLMAMLPKPMQHTLLKLHSDDN